MNFIQNKKKIYHLVKVISIILISSVIAGELGNIYAGITNELKLIIPVPVVWLGRFALIAHLIEGMIASFYAPAKGKPAIQYGIYTFFTGTVGLLELFEGSDEDLIQKT
jgi:hypothetical protein